MQADDALPVKNGAASGVQTNTKSDILSFEVGSVELNPQCLMLKHELRIYLVFNLEKNADGLKKLSLYNKY